MINPVRNIEFIKIFANALVVWFVVMDIIPLTEIQQGATLTLFISGINAAGAWFQNRQTTPLADPKVKLESGAVVSLVREDNRQPTPQAMERAVAERGRA